MNDNRIKVFVTGGSGFIGSHLVDKLVAENYDVTVLARRSSDLSFLPLEKIDLWEGDVRNYESIKQGMRGCGIIFHVAALACDWADKKDFYQTNVGGTRNILHAAKENGIENIVFVSTTGVLGEEDCIVKKSEGAPYKPKMNYFLSRICESDMNHYRHSKTLAEKEALEYAKQNNINLTVIRPVWVYGPREFHAGPFEFCKALSEGVRVFPMGKNNKFHIIYVKDLANAIVLAANKNLPGVHIFNVGNKEPPNIRWYFNLFCKHLNIKTPAYLPFFMVYPVGIFLEVIAKLIRAREPLLLTRARVKMFYCNNIYDVSKSNDMLGFEAEMPIEDGVKETVAWWKKNGYLLDQREAKSKLKQRYIFGFERKILDLRMGITIFIRYLILLLRGKISIRQYLIFVKRIILLSEVLSYNKAFQINNVYKIHLYLPGFPSKAFYKAIDKFLILSEETIPTMVVLSMTKACGYNCVHCYQKNDGGEDLPIDKLIEVARDIQNIGVSMFDIEGGEPLLKFDRLLELIESLNDTNEIWINSTGHTLTFEKAMKLKHAGLFGVMVSIHHWLPTEHDKFVGKKGAFAIACSAIRTFQRAGINTVINCCPSLEMICNGGIEQLLKLAREFNCSFVQYIHEKPAGAWLKRGSTLMDKLLLDDLCKKHITLNRMRRYRSYPSVSMQVFESSPMAFGCTAGGVERFYLNAQGEVQPCEFLNVSFGNVKEEKFVDIYKRMREKFKKPTLNWLCNYECTAIANYIKDNNITSYPLKKEIAKQFIDNFDMSREVPLYKRMKLCEKA